MKTKIEEAVDKWSYQYREILAPKPFLENLKIVYSAEKKLLIRSMGCRRWENKI